MDPGGRRIALRYLHSTLARHIHVSLRGWMGVHAAEDLDDKTGSNETHRNDYDLLHINSYEDSVLSGITMLLTCKESTGETSWIQNSTDIAERLDLSPIARNKTCKPTSALTERSSHTGML